MSVFGRRRSTCPTCRVALDEADGAWRCPTCRTTWDTPPAARLRGKPAAGGRRSQCCPNATCTHPRGMHDIPEPGPRVERCQVFDCRCGAAA